MADKFFLAYKNINLLERNLQKEHKACIIFKSKCDWVAGVERGEKMLKNLGATLYDRDTGDELGRVFYDPSTQDLSGDALSGASSGQEVTLLVDIAPGKESRYLGVVVCSKNGNARWMFEGSPG